MAHERPDKNDPAPDQGSLHEQLVAYLDGELDHETGRRVEELLATDPAVRDTLEKLEGTWDLLDSLGRAHVDEFFTRSTLEMVAVAAADDAEQEKQEAPRRRRRQWLIAAASVLTACGVGFLAVALFWPDPNRQLLKDLPVLERIDEYRQIDDIEFLELLAAHKAELFPEESGNAP